MRWIEAGRLIMVTALGCGLVACSLFGGEPSAVERTSLAVADAQTLAEARRLFEANNPGLALQRVDAYLAANPESASGHNLAGVILDHIGRYDLAQAHYEKALTLQADYLPAVNNFGLSKLRRARATGRPDLEQEAEALLARAVELSAEGQQLALLHNAVRAALSPTEPAQATAAAAAKEPRTAWLERRSESYTYVVTKPSPAVADAMARDLDPSLALVSPGATMGTTFVSIALLPAQRTRAWIAVPKTAPRLVAAAPGLSVLSLKAQTRWYRGFPAAVEPPPLSAETALNARAQALLRVAALP